MNRDAITCIQQLSRLLQAIQDMGVINKLNKENCEFIINNAINFIATNTCKEASFNPPQLPNAPDQTNE